MKKTITLMLTIGVFSGISGTETLAQQSGKNAELVPTCNQQAGFATYGRVDGGTITITCPTPRLQIPDSGTLDLYGQTRGYVETDGVENDYSQYEAPAN